MDVSSIFAFALIGGLVGFILGDFQREVRLRRDARRQLELSRAVSAADSSPGTHNVTVLRSGFDNFPVPGPNSDRDRDSDGPAFALGSVRNGQARRAAIPGDNNRARAASRVRGGDVRGTAKTSVSAGYDCG